MKISQSNFENTFERYFDHLVNYANSILYDSILSEDLVQEVFLKLWEKRDKLQIQNSLKEYLFRSVRNRCINSIRNQKLVEVYQNENTSAGDEEHDVSLMDNKEDNIQLLYHAIENLTPKRKQILQYGLFGLKNQEIAEIMGVSVNTLKTQKSHAYRKLRCELIAL